MIRKVCTLLIALALAVGLGCSSSAVGLLDHTSQLVGEKEEAIESGPELEVQVVFPDKNLEAAIREALGQPEGAIYASDLGSLARLETAGGRGIVDLSGLEYCVGLEFLMLSGNPIADLSPISQLPGRTVWITDQNGEVFSYVVLSIRLSGCQIIDLSSLAGLTGPDELQLFLMDNQIEDLTPLAGLTNLSGLYLSRNQIRDVSPLAGLTKLYLLDLWGNQIEDIFPLAGLVGLSWLELEQNQIRDISPLAGMPILDSVALSYNQIEDLSPLASLNTSLERLRLDHNEISDVSPLAGLTQLALLDLSYNKISDISALCNFTDSTEIKLEGNPVFSGG